MGYTVSSVAHSYIVLQHPGGVAHHILVVSQLLVASGTVVVARDQRVVAAAVRHAINSLRVLGMRTSEQHQRP